MVQSSISSSSSGTIGHSRHSYFPPTSSTPRAGSVNSNPLDKDPFRPKDHLSFHPSLELEYPTPSIYDLTLILSADVGIDKFWRNIVNIFATHFRASRITLVVPHDLTDISNTPWGLKASWNVDAVDGYQPSMRRKSSSSSHSDQSMEWENMEDYADIPSEPATRRGSEAREDMEANVGVVFRTMQRLDAESQPLLESSGVPRVTERGGKLVVLSREYQDISGYMQAADTTPGGSNLIPNVPSVSVRQKEPKLRDPFAEEVQSSTSNHLTDTSSSQTAGFRKFLSTSRYEDYEQPASSPWTQSPAPSPAIQSDANKDPFFTNQHNIPLVDEATFAPADDDEEDHTPLDEKMFQTLGTEGTFSVIHIPLIHPSAARQIALTGRKSPQSQIPIAILSFQSSVIPYPANLTQNLTTFAPFIATSLSQALSHSSILHQLAYSASVTATQTACSPESTESLSGTPSPQSHDAVSTPLSNSSGNDTSYFVRTSSLRRGVSEDNATSGSADNRMAKPEIQRSASSRKVSTERSRQSRENTAARLAPDEGTASKTSRVSSPGAILNTRRRRQTSDSRSRSLIHSFGASLATSFHPAGHTTSDSRQRGSSKVLPQPSSRLMRVIVDAIPVCVMTASPINGRVTWVNDRTLAFTGKSAEDYLHTQWGCLHPDDQNHYIRAWRTAINSGEGFARQTRMRRFDGTYRWFMARAVPLRDSQGVTVHWFGTMMDVHDQKIAEGDASRQKETKASESKYRSLAEASPQIVFAASSRTGITYANTQWLKYSGKTLEETQGFAFFTQIHPEDRNKCFLPRNGQLKADENLISEIRLREHTGDYKWHLVKCICSERRPDHGEEMWLGTCTDINDHKLLEQRLQEAKELAFKNVESKTRFLSNMSHEIRTPLIGITGMINFLLDTNLTAEQLDYAHTVQQSAEALLAVINDILDLSKVEAGMMKLAREEFPVRAMVEDAVELLSTLAISKKLELNYLVEEDVPEIVIGDRVRLRQVLLNIMGNAIKFTTVGEIFVRCFTVAAKGLEENEIMIGWETIDSGPGFSDEEGALLFKPFSQVDGSLTRKHDGTGLGLVISRQLAELHGGTISCTSTKGVGSTFTFTARFKIAPGGRMEEIETRNTMQRTLTPDNAVRTKPVAFEVLVLSHSVWSTVALNHHIRVVVPRDVESTIVTSDRFAASLEIVADAKQPVFTHIVVNLLEVSQTLQMISVVQSIERYNRSVLLVVSTPLTRNNVLEEAARTGVVINKFQVNFVYKVIKPAKLSKFFDPSSERNESVDSRRETAQLVVQTQKAVFNEMHDNVGNKGFHVLLVEDNPVNQKVMTKFCRKAGLEVTTADDGVQCLQKLQDNPTLFNIILMDLHMPNLDGYQACAQIREQERNAGSSRIPIIALSANVMGDVVHKCTEAGFDQYLSKPVSFSRLSAKIFELVGPIKAV